MQKCFLCLIFTHFALWTMVRAEYGIKKSTGISYLWMEFPSVTEAIFPRNLTVNLSITNFVGPLMYSIDANGNQLIVTMSGTSMNLLVESMGGQQQKISLRGLCGCKVCLYVPLLLEFGMNNSTIWTRCNRGVTTTVLFNSGSRSFKKGYPTLKPKQKDASSNANSADLYFVNYLRPLTSEQMQGCIFAIEYNGQPNANNLTIVGSAIAKDCRRTCNIDKCKGGVCYDTYGSESICDCSTVFGNGQYCSDDSQLVNKNFNYKFPKFVGIKLSWRSNGKILWRIGNKQSTLNLTIDDSRQLVLTRQDPQRKSIDKNILLTEYIPNESYVLILLSNETNSFKNENNVTMIYASYDVLKDGDNLYDDMILSSCDGVMDMATLSDEYDLQWNRFKMEESSSSAYNPACEFPVKRDSHKPNNGLLWLLVFLSVAVIAALMIAVLMWIRHREKKKARDQHSNGDMEEREDLYNPIVDSVSNNPIVDFVSNNQMVDDVSNNPMFIVAESDTKIEGYDEDLIRAAADGRLEDVKYLIDNGADINAVDSTERTALYYAAVKRHLEVVNHLIASGADVNAVDKWNGLALDYDLESGRLEFRKCPIPETDLMCYKHLI